MTEDIKRLVEGEYMGLHEAAQLYGFTKQAVFNRLQRGTMPKPLVQLQMGPVWRASDLVAHKRHLDNVSAPFTKETDHGGE